MIQNSKYIRENDEEHIFFHIDVNSAFLSWTAMWRLKNGDTVDLRTIPAIIGGDEAARHGIVLAKSIPCKKYGIETAEPIAMALKKCPNLTIASPDFTLYKTCSANMMNYIKSYCPDIEQVSIDECYMDYTPIAHLYSDPLECAKEISCGIRENFGFTVNIGISNRKVLAKMASDFQKPDKIHTLYTYEIHKKMWPLPVSDLFMCGKSSTATLNKLGIKTIGDLAKMDTQILDINLKSIGSLLHDYANGIDSSKICTHKEKEKSISHAHTSSSDITNRDDASRIILGLSDEAAIKLRNSGFFCQNVTIEIKYSTFVSTSHQQMLDSYTDDANVIHNIAMKLFDGIWNGAPIRLLGVRLGKFIEKDGPIQMSLFDAPKDEGDKQKLLNEALDKIKTKYGKDSVKRLSQK